MDHIDRYRSAKGPGQDAFPGEFVRTLRAGMDPGSPARSGTADEHGGTVPRQPDQLGLGRAFTAPHTGTDGFAHADSTAVSGRMSIFQPVSFAARRAFCPSRPIARLNW